MRGSDGYNESLFSTVRLDEAAGGFQQLGDVPRAVGDAREARVVGQRRGAHLGEEAPQCVSVYGIMQTWPSRVR